MSTSACSLTIALLAGTAAGDDAVTTDTVATYRTHGAVSARPQCGYTDELQNLLPQSARFPAGTWRAAAAAGISPAVEPNADACPTGDRDAARVTFDASDVPTPERWSCLETTATVIPGETYTFSFSVKGPEGAFITARGAAGRGFSRIPLNGRWQRVHLTEVASGTSPTLRIGLGAHDAGEAPAPARVTVLLWGPQLILGRGTVPYRASGEVPLPAWPLALVAPDEVRTACPPADAPQPAATNLLRWTADPKRAPWIATGLTGAHSGQGASPIGLRDAHLLQESKGPGPHALSQPFDCPGAGPFVASIYVRPGKREHAELELRLPGGEGRARFDLVAGTAMATGGEASPRIDRIGTGWLRIQVSAKAGAAGPSELLLRLLDRQDGAPEYEGDGSGGLLAWGPQVEAGTEATSHIPTFFIPETRGADEPLAPAVR
jgi:hypothetical protein